MLVKLALFLPFLATAVQCQSNVWNGITPLKSTRADVEKILGAPVPGSIAKHAAGYRTAAEEVSILYSAGPCSNKPGHGWNIPELRGIRVTVYPKSLPDFDESKIDLKEFVKHTGTSLSGAAYMNERACFSIVINTWDKVITGYHYFPESKYNHLKCKK